MLAWDVFDLNERVFLRTTTAQGAFGAKIFRHPVCRPEALIVPSGILALNRPII